MEVRQSSPLPTRDDYIAEPPLHGGGGIHAGTPDRGFGGDDSGNQDGPSVSSYQERLRRLRWLVGISMVSVTMLFIALTMAFFLRQRAYAVDETGNHISGWLHLSLPPLLVINTFILLLSSLTLELARRNLRQQLLLAPLRSIPGIRHEPQRSLPWLGITLVLGCGFLAGQISAWRMMQHEGFFLAANPASTFFYLLTVAHAIHFSIGMIALIYASVAHVVTHRLEMRCVIVDVTSWYWHFMAVLWIYVYALLSFAQ
jgi:cytochrome c oxidase subunit 3